MLSDTQRKRLLLVARQAIRAACCGEPEPDLRTDDPQLLAPCGAFVTLHTKEGALRGCIGLIEARLPLIETIYEMAIAAATQDPRFPPVSCAEVPHLHIEISVLSLPREIQDINEIEVGRHGLIISRGGRRGLLLPQVATEYNWDREEFLQHTCMKAGLPPEAWRDSGTKIECFEAEVFGEED